MPTLTAQQLEEFTAQGVVCVRGAFDADAAAAMRDEMWAELKRKYGMDPDDRSTWRVECPDHLQGLKKRPAFAAIGSAATRGSLDDILGPGTWSVPNEWGAFFVLLPHPGAVRDVPTDGWHIDEAYNTPVSPPAGVRVIALFGDLDTGGTMVITGSHRVVETFGATLPPDVVAKNAKRRALLHSHPWFADLARAGAPEARAQRFMRDGGDIDGVDVRATELVGNAGDVWMMHPGLLHARPVHAGTLPRFMTSKYVYRSRPTY